MLIIENVKKEKEKISLLRQLSIFYLFPVFYACFYTVEVLLYYRTV